jgi:iron complex outermembrane recepter protein
MNRYPRIGSAVLAVLATANAVADPQQHRELEEIVVTATPIAQDRLSTAQPTSVLTGDALLIARAPTIGETVSGEPGVRSTFYGPAASRPIIRGLGGDRVQMLTDGLANLDASGLSEDHAVAIDPALADQIEVIRGPATLLYGSGAAGGLVNVVTNRLHDTVPEGVDGLLEVRGDTALGERAVAGRFDAGAGRFALHLDGVWRETDDYEIPGFAQSRRLRNELIVEGEEPDEMRGTVDNSASSTTSGGIGVSYIGDRWMLGLAWNRYETDYGIPAGHGHGHEEEEEHEEEEHEEEEGDLTIDLKQDRFDLAARFDLDAFGGSVLRLRGAANDYQHAELEPDGEIGTLFEVEGRELRAALEHGRREGLHGTVGVQWQDVDLLAEGEEAFIPNSNTRTVGVFAFQKRDFQVVSLEYGLRWDRQEIEAGELPAYDDTSINASFGALRQLTEGLALVGQVVRSERHPSATELYADGPHAATRQFEIGDPDLSTERAVTADLGLRASAGVVTGEIRAFVSRYDGYIYLSPTGEEEDELPVFEYLQRDARFYGVEAEFELPLGTDSGFALTLSGDYVRGKLDRGGDLPRIPPLRLGARLGWTGGPFSTSLSAQHHFEQDQVSSSELPTDSYTLVDAELAWRPGWNRNNAVLFLRGRNLLDEDARVHSSPLKDDLPLPGRSLTAGLRIGFGR